MTLVAFAPVVKPVDSWFQPVWFDQVDGSVPPVPRAPR